MTGQQVGYIRVSSEGQNTDRQLEHLTLNKIYIDKLSGSTKDRPELQKCIDFIREGDCLHVHSIDRLARNLRDLQELLDLIISKGVSVKFHTERLSFSGQDNPMDKLTLQLMGAFAEFERKISKNRQREGIDAARKRGKHLGRPKLAADLYHKAKELYAQGKTVLQIGEELKLSHTSIYKLLKGVPKRAESF